MQKPRFFLMQVLKVMCCIVLIHACSKISRIKKEVDLIHEFRTHAPGIWVKEAYINELTSTKSVLKASQYLAGFCSITIWDSEINDSINVGASWNNHEGSGFRMYQKVGKSGAGFKTNIKDYENANAFADLSFEREGENTVLMISYYNGISPKPAEVARYLKVSNISNQVDQTDKGFGIDLVTNRTIVFGKHQLSDSTGNSWIIAMDENGHVFGHPEFVGFFIVTDLRWDSDPDIISFTDSLSASKGFIFESNQDTLRLFECIGNYEDYEPIYKGKLVHTLVKQEN